MWWGLEKEKQESRGTSHRHLPNPTSPYTLNNSHGAGPCSPQLDTPPQFHHRLPIPLWPPPAQWTTIMPCHRLFHPHPISLSNVLCQDLMPPTPALTMRIWETTLHITKKLRAKRTKGNSNVKVGNHTPSCSFFF